MKRKPAPLIQMYRPSWYRYREVRYESACLILMTAVLAGLGVGALAAIIVGWTQCVPGWLLFLWPSP